MVWWRDGAWLLIVFAALVSPPDGIAARALSGDRGFFSEGERAAIYRHSPLVPPRANPTNRFADDAGAAALGQRLFFEGGLSGNGWISCATCHKPESAFADGRALAKSLALGTRNTPTLLNAAYQHWFFWDGRSDSLWSQVLHVLENPSEFGADRLHIAHAIFANGDLRLSYEKIFGKMPPLSDARRFPPHARPGGDVQEHRRAWERLTASDRDAVNRVFSNVGKSIEAYERKLVGGDSPFDIYVEGLRKEDPKKLAALSQAAKRGLKLFVGPARCDLCHSGPAFSDGEFHNIGLPVPQGGQPDPGRSAGIARLKADVFNGVGPYSDSPDGLARDKLQFLPAAESETGKFRTPTLRNVSRTAPYMHDGRFVTLREVVQFYVDGPTARRGRQVGFREGTLDLIPRLTPEQVSDLVAFLNTLNDAELPSRLLQKPSSK